MQGFCICQVSEYTSSSENTSALVMPGSEYAMFLNIQRFWICQGYTRFGICVNMPKLAWRLCFAFPYSTPFSIWTRGCLFQSLHETRRFSLKEHGAVFWRAKVGRICFVFCFRLNSFISKISNLLLPFGGRESWYTLTGF